MIELSIIVPVYNAGTILKHCIEKILAQTYEDFELILVNDGSIDNSGKICDAYAIQDSRVTVIHKENGGAGSARNAGIEIAKGRFLTFPDADDFCISNMYQTMMSEMQKQESDLVICSYESVKVDELGNIVSRQPQLLFNENVCGEQAVRELWFKIRCMNISILNTPWNKIYRKDIIDKYHLRFPNERRAQDAIFNIQYYDKIRTVTIIDQPLYQYNANDVVRKGKKFPQDVYKCFYHFDKLMKETVIKWGMYHGEYKTLCDNHFIGILDDCVEMCNNPIWGLNKQDKIDYLNVIINDNYTQETLAEYTGNIFELEDIIPPILKKDAKLVLKALARRNRREKLRNSFIGKIYRKIRGTLK